VTTTAHTGCEIYPFIFQFIKILQAFRFLYRSQEHADDKTRATEHCVLKVFVFKLFTE
jgi:hypothetical protein